MPPAAGAASLVALGFLYGAMTVGKVSVVAPIVSSGAILPVLFGLLGGNHLSGAQLGGVVAILMGVPLAASSRGAASDKLGNGTALAILAALGTGSWLVLMDRASTTSPLSATLVMRLTSVTVMFIITSLPRSSRSRGPAWSSVSRKSWTVMAAVGIFDALAELLFSLASHSGALSVVSPLASLYPVVTVALAITVLRERVLPAQVLGSVLALAGSVILSM